MLFLLLKIIERIRVYINKNLHKEIVMKKICVIGSLNMDLVVNVDTMPKPGQTLIGSNFKEVPGGKGANQAVAMARLRWKCIYDR